MSRVVAGEPRTPAPRGPGRPSTSESLSQHVQFRIAPVDWARIERLARATGETVAEWIRRTALAVLAAK